MYKNKINEIKIQIALGVDVYCAWCDEVINNLENLEFVNNEIVCVNCYDDEFYTHFCGICEGYYEEDEISDLELRPEGIFQISNDIKLTEIPKNINTDDLTSEEICQYCAHKLI